MRSFGAWPPRAGRTLGSGELALDSFREPELAALGERERRILKLRFGLGGEATHSLRQVGEDVGVSRERVRQIQNQALIALHRERDPNWKPGS